jgi:hypothetical protein
MQRSGHRPVIPVLETEDCKFKANLGCAERGEREGKKSTKTLSLPLFNKGAQPAPQASGSQPTPRQLFRKEEESMRW